MSKRQPSGLSSVEEMRDLQFQQLGLIGTSRAIREVQSQIYKLKDVDSTILLLGESGSGKELIARALHALSKRRLHLFEGINCSAIPESLLESELFGYKKGAFTDAKTDKTGVFEICDQGTLFLDEIGDMPLSLQVKMLRFLQEKEIRPVGSNKSLKLNTRVIAATNKKLPEEIKNKNFREDLFYRLSVFVVYVPPLRKRKEDIPFLVEHFVDLFNKHYNRAVKKPSKDLMTSLLDYDWPGNIRELKHAIERGVVLSKDQFLCLEDLIPLSDPFYDAPILLPSEIKITCYSEAKERFEKDYLEQVLSATKGNISEAARISGRFRSDIYRLMKRYELSH